MPRVTKLMRKGPKSQPQVDPNRERFLNSCELPEIPEIMLCIPEPKAVSVSFSSSPVLRSLCIIFHNLRLSVRMIKPTSYVNHPILVSNPDTRHRAVAPKSFSEMGTGTPSVVNIPQYSHCQLSQMEPSWAAVNHPQLQVDCSQADS